MKKTCQMKHANVIYITPRDRNVRPLNFLLNLRLIGQDPGLFHSGLFSGFRGLKIVCIHWKLKSDGNILGTKTYAASMQMPSF